MFEAYLLFLLLIIMVGLFIWGYWRHDVVAFMALVLAIIIGVVSPANAFSGFSNPAVVTVACVMVITYAITQSGIVDNAVKHLTPLTSNFILHLGLLCFIAALLSAFMNNVGALALMMPIAIQSAKKNNCSPSLVLMPLSFASVLGGLCTAIGTPPNLLISSYREQVVGEAFGMFDFSPVGVFVALVAISFIVLFGWRLIPSKERSSQTDEEAFSIQDYTCELKVPAKSSLVGQTFAIFMEELPPESKLVAYIRQKKKRLQIDEADEIKSQDVLTVQASHEVLQQLIRKWRLELVGADIIFPEKLKSEEVVVVESVVVPDSFVEGRSWSRMRLRYRFNLSLIAISRKGKLFKNRLQEVSLRPGDVVLLQGDSESMADNLSYLGLLPLAERGVDVGIQRKAFIPIGLLIAGICVAAFQILPIAVSLSFVVLILVLLNVISVRKVYTSIDWSIIVLLAALIPIGQALESTGGTALIANFVMMVAGQVHPLFILALLLVITMTLSDIMNNAATAVVMAPISVSIAQSLGVNVDAFLMAVAVGASCSFLTPISHQNNTLVMGPGGYRFSDYFRLGLPVELIVLVVALPLISIVWPL